MHMPRQSSTSLRPFVFFVLVDLVTWSRPWPGCVAIFVAHAGLVAVLPLSLSATPKQQCARDLNQLATWPLVRRNPSYAVCPARPVSRSG